MNKKPDWKAEFCTMLEKLAERRSIWRVWSDFITLAAITISNLVKTSSWDEREEEYLSIIHTYQKEEQDIIVQLFAVIQLAYVENDKQDFLGNVCQELELLQKLKKQYFSPYSVSVASAEFECEKLIWNDRLEMEGYLSVYDPACGTGTMLIAFAHMLQKKGINPQTNALFVGQDVDRISALTCYIQLAILGLPAYVIVGDTLSSPGRIPGNEVWYTPEYIVNAGLFADNQELCPEECGQSAPFDGRGEDLSEDEEEKRAS